MAKTSYHPGVPQPATKNPDGSYSVDSFRGEAAAYTVTLGSHPACSCPHFQARLKETGGECKHIASVKAQARFLECADRARKLSDEQLDRWLQVHQAQDNLIVAGAIRVERHRRKQAAATDTAMRELFA